MTNPPKPILSLLGDNPAFDERIDAFVIALGERVDEFQDAELAGGLDRVRALSRSLASEAGELGYPALTAAARRVELSCDDGPEAIHKAIVDLTELAQRVRRGHRSAAG